MILLDTNHLIVLRYPEHSYDALLLSADLSDFERVPGLKVENWLT